MPTKFLALAVFLTFSVSVFAQRSLVNTLSGTTTSTVINGGNAQLSDIVWSGKLNVPNRNGKMFQVVSYKVSTVLRGYTYEVHNKGARFSDEAINLMKKLRPGNKLYFEDIIVREADGNLRNIGSMTFRIQ